MKAVGQMLLLVAGVAWGGDQPAQSDAPPLQQQIGAAKMRVTATLAKNAVELPFTDLLRALVEVEGDAGLEVQPPDPWAGGPWLVKPSAAPVRKEINGKTRWSQELLLEPTQPGDLALALAPLRYRGGDGEWQTAAWKPIAVHVTSRLKQPSVKSARDITAIEELPPSPPAESRAYMVIFGLVGAAGAIGFATILLRRGRKNRPGRTPEAWASYELQRLQALGLPEQGKHERFGTLLTGLVRRYLEKKYHLPARRRTTGEFLAALDGQTGLASQRDFLEGFLQRCDLLKFAPVSTSPEECRALAEQARQFLAQQQQPVLGAS